MSARQLRLGVEPAPKKYPFLDEEEGYFPSGSNHPGEIDGLAQSGCNVGVTASEIGAEAVDALQNIAHAGARIFIDSGAFSEVEFGPGGPVVVQPISDEKWRARLDLYERLARLVGDQLWCVAPDRVGDQEETVRRLRTYSRELMRIAALGAHVIIPIQKGETSMADFCTEAALAAKVYAFAAGIPMKKDATGDAELAAFVREWQPRAIHLLGLGPSSSRYRATLRIIRREARDYEPQITCDSVRITALVGRSGATPRALTQAQDDIRAEGKITTVRARKAESLARVMWAEHKTRLEEAYALGWNPDADEDE